MGEDFGLIQIVCKLYIVYGIWIIFWIVSCVFLWNYMYEIIAWIFYPNLSKNVHEVRSEKYLKKNRGDLAHLPEDLVLPKNSKYFKKEIGNNEKNLTTYRQIQSHLTSSAHSKNNESTNVESSSGKVISSSPVFGPNVWIQTETEVKNTLSTRIEKHHYTWKKGPWRFGNAGEEVRKYSSLGCSKSFHLSDEVRLIHVHN